MAVAVLQTPPGSAGYIEPNDPDGGTVFRTSKGIQRFYNKVGDEI
jgi:hypothetical protein